MEIEIVKEYELKKGGVLLTVEMDDECRELLIELGFNKLLSDAVKKQDKKFK